MSSTVVNFGAEKARRESKQIRENLRRLASRMSLTNPMREIALAIADGDVDRTDALLVAQMR